MSDMVVEKLTQKVSNMLEEIGEVNILIRRMTPTQETLNRINERVDAVHVVLKQLENGVQLDETRLTNLGDQIKLIGEAVDEQVKLVRGWLEEQIALLQEGWESAKKSMSGLEMKVDGAARSVDMTTRQRWEAVHSEIARFKLVQYITLGAFIVILLAVLFR